VDLIVLETLNYFPSKMEHPHSYTKKVDISIGVK